MASQQCDVVCLLQLLDQDGDNMINFRDFVWVLGVMARADMPSKLKLLFRIHQPPALLPTDADLVDSPVSGKTDTCTGI